MLPTINGKSFLDCNEDDLQIILDNPDYREDEYIDYKREFSVNQYPTGKTKERQEAIADLKSDICAFANSDGGYLIYGVTESEGIPNKIDGIEIKDSNIEKFERELKNYIHTIQPHVPHYQLKFVLLNNDRFVVILHIQHDAFTPYMHLENEKDYRVYKRIGNSNVIVGYTELKNMFIQSISLDRAIESFRKERIDYYHSQEDDNELSNSKFLILHIIPETFIDRNYNKFIFVEHTKGIDFSSIFQYFDCNNRSFPSVEGMRFTCYDGKAEAHLYNNGIAEVFFPLFCYISVAGSSYPNGFLSSSDMVYKIESTAKQYINKIKELFQFKRIFICVSIVGCKNVMTKDHMVDIHRSSIDRNLLICEPIVVENINSDSSVERALKEFQLAFLISLSIKNDSRVTELIKELYG